MLPDSFGQPPVGLGFESPATALNTEGGICLVLADKLTAVPGLLAAALSRRGFTVQVVTDSPSVMLSLAQQTPPCLVVVNPDSVPMISELVQAVRAYHPGVAMWSFTQPAGGGPKLDSFNGHYHPSPASSDADLRQPLDELVVRVPCQTQDIQGPIVSEEELTMLLGPTPETPTPAPTRFSPETLAEEPVPPHSIGSLR